MRERPPHPAVTPWGTFSLDTTGASVIAALVSNAGSTGSSTIMVPSLPALRGLLVFVQGIDLALPSGNFHYTNFLVATIE